MTIPREWRAAVVIVATMAMVVAFGFVGGPTAAETPGGELWVGGPLVDSQGNWVADFELHAAESPIPEFFPNGGFEEGEAGDEWGADGLSLNRFHFDEPPLPDPFVGEFSLHLDPQGDGEGFAIVCLGGTEPGATLDVGFLYALAEPPADGDGLFVQMSFFDTEEPCNADTGDVLGDYDVRIGPLTSTDPTEEGFQATVPGDYPYDFFPSFALIFEMQGVTGLGVFLDNISVTSPDFQSPPGVGELFFSIFGDALSACDTHGPSAEPGLEGILGQIGCGGSGGQAVSIKACKADLQMHGFVHSDAPNTTFLGQVVIDVTLNANRKNAEWWGNLTVDIYTPKDVITLSGNIPREGSEGFVMSTCDQVS